MGNAYSWLAIKDASADEVCRALGLARRDGAIDVSKTGLPELGFCAATLPGGWYVVVAGADVFDWFRGPDLGELSRAHDLVLLEADENTMYVSLSRWRGGAPLWRVTHDGEEGTYHLVTEGELPAEFEPLHLEYAGRQDDAGGSNASLDWLCEIPVELGRAITGFAWNRRHDDDEGGPVFEALDIRERRDFGAQAAG